MGQFPHRSPRTTTTNTTTTRSDGRMRDTRRSAAKIILAEDSRADRLPEERARRSEEPLLPFEMDGSWIHVLVAIRPAETSVERLRREFRAIRGDTVGSFRPFYEAGLRTPVRYHSLPLLSAPIRVPYFLPHPFAHFPPPAVDKQSFVFHRDWQPRGSRY